MDKKGSMPVELVLCREVNKGNDIHILEILKIIYSHKIFVTFFTLLSLLLAWLYLKFTKPIYKIEAFYELGYYLNQDKQKSYFLDSKTLNYTIEYKFDKSNDANKSYPKIEIKKFKSTTGLLNITIQDHSNKKAIEALNNIINYIKEKEKKESKVYKNLAQRQINLLNNTIKNYQNSVKLLSYNNSTNKDVGGSIYKDMILKSQILKSDYNFTLDTITYVNRVGEIKVNKNPIKPRKLLISILFGVIGLTISIFLVFVFRSIKSYNIKQ